MTYDDDADDQLRCYFRYSKRAPPMDYVDHKNAKVAAVQTVQKGVVTGTKKQQQQGGGGSAFKFLFEHFGGRAKVMTRIMRKVRTMMMVMMMLMMVMMVMMVMAMMRMRMMVMWLL